MQSPKHSNPQSNVSLIQPLESRRLMSITTATIEPFVPHAAATILMDHAAANQKSDASFAQNFTPQPQFDQFGGPHPVEIDGGASSDHSNDQLYAQFAHAIAQGTPLILSPASAGNSQGPTASVAASTATTVAADQTRLTTISSLYNLVDKSTVAAIDDAELSSSHGSALTNLLTPQSCDQPSTETSQESASASSVTIVTAPQNTATGILLASFAVNSTPADTTDAFGIDWMEDRGAATAQPSTALNEAARTDSNSLLSRSMLQSLEQELFAVKAYSQQVVFNLGRDRAVELSQAQAANDISQERSSDWKTTAAIIGAAVASVVYAEKELVRGKKNVGSVFSVRPLCEGLMRSAFAG